MMSSMARFTDKEDGNGRIRFTKVVKRGPERNSLAYLAENCPELYRFIDL
jgi:hypothetical protein